MFSFGQNEGCDGVRYIDDSFQDVTISSNVLFGTNTTIGGKSQDLFMDIYLGKYIFIFIKIILIFPLYQVLLLIFGAIFFQFTFFWNIEKQLLKKIGFKKFF